MSTLGPGPATQTDPNQINSFSVNILLTTPNIENCVVGCKLVPQLQVHSPQSEMDGSSKPRTVAEDTDITNQEPDIVHIFNVRKIGMVTKSKEKSATWSWIIDLERIRVCRNKNANFCYAPSVQLTVLVTRSNNSVESKRNLYDQSQSSHQSQKDMNSSTNVQRRWSEPWHRQDQD